MEPKDMFELSFYEEIKPINNKKNVYLVSHVETGILYVKKIYTNYNMEVFARIKALNIPGIPKCKLMIEDKDTQTLTIIEEYINGINLDNYLSLKDGPLSSGQAATIIDNICRILQQLHSQIPPIIHRDIKPSNILISQNNKVYIVDFNISRVLTNNDSDTTILGTQGYAAPEQYGFMQCTERTDIYSLGVLLKFLLTKSPLLPHKYQGPLAPIIRCATAMDPADRYQTVGDFNMAIKVALRNESQSQRTATQKKPRTIQPELNPNVQNRVSKGTSTWFTIKRSWQQPFNMSKKAKVSFIVATVLISLVGLVPTSGSTIPFVNSLFYTLIFLSWTVYPIFAVYYVYKKKIRLSSNDTVNFLIHGLIIVLSVLVLFFGLMGIFILAGAPI